MSPLHTAYCLLLPRQWIAFEILVPEVVQLLHGGRRHGPIAGGKVFSQLVHVAHAGNDGGNRGKGEHETQGGVGVGIIVRDGPDALDHLSPAPTTAGLQPHARNSVWA